MVLPCKNNSFLGLISWIWYYYMLKYNHPFRTAILLLFLFYPHHFRLYVYELKGRKLKFPNFPLFHIPSFSLYCQLFPLLLMSSSTWLNILFCVYLMSPLIKLQFLCPSQCLWPINCFHMYRALWPFLWHLTAWHKPVSH